MYERAGYIACIYVWSTPPSTSLCLLLPLSFCVSPIAWLLVSRAHIPVTIPLCGRGKAGVRRAASLRFWPSLYACVPACVFVCVYMLICVSVCSLVWPELEIEHIKANADSSLSEVDLMMLFATTLL